MTLTRENIALTLRLTQEAKKESLLVAALLAAWDERDAVRLERDEFKRAEREVSDAYIRIRSALGAWATDIGGGNRFAVTEAKLAMVIARAEAAEAKLAERDAENARLRDALQPFCFFGENNDDTQTAWETRYLDRFKDWIDFEDIEDARAALNKEPNQ